ncbi:nitrite reductase [Alteribacter natronophilus]|nr:nitrite reductase [Alteribacter natronophilus]
MILKKKFTAFAVNGGIGFGAKLTPKQLVVLGNYLDEDQEIELTTFQQLIIKVEEEKAAEAEVQLKRAGFSVYKVGPYVKSLRTCNFCKGEEREGMPVAKELNARIAGQPVPFTLRASYTGCSNACGEPLINDIGVIKRKDTYDLYVGGKATGEDARTGRLLKDGLKPNELYDLVDEVLGVYRENGRKRERIAKFVDRFGFDNLKREVGL